MKITVLGNGGFGTAMAIAAWRAGNAVALWGHDAGYTAAIAASRENPRYLAGVRVPEEILVTTDAGAAAHDAGVVLVAIPTRFLRATVAALAPAFPDGVPVVSLAKGLERGTCARPSEVLAAAAPGRPVLVLSGPSHAEEVARGLPTALVVGGDDAAEQQRLQAAIGHDRLRVYRNPDVVGVEVCGALKNVMALAAGIAEGLGFGDNSKAAIVARGLVEMARFGRRLGAMTETFWGLAGVGDLAATAFSEHSRNRAFGERLGRGETLAEIEASTPKVAEGVWTARVALDIASREGIDMPITAAVHGVLFEGRSAAEVVTGLMEREPKPEM